MIFKANEAFSSPAKVSTYVGKYETLIIFGVDNETVTMGDTSIATAKWNSNKGGYDITGVKAGSTTLKYNDTPIPITVKTYVAPTTTTTTTTTVKPYVPSPDNEEVAPVTRSENNKPTLFMRYADGEEFNPSDTIPELTFLGDTYTPAMTNTMQQFPSVDGSLYNFSAINSDQIIAKFRLDYKTYTELKSLRHKVYKLFMQKKMVELRTDAEPFMLKQVYPTGFAVEPAAEGSLTALVTINYDNPSGYLFSLNATDKLSNLWDDFSFAHVVNAMATDYAYTTNNFSVWNDSAKVIDPYYNHDELKIMVSFKGGAIELVNNTNGSSWKYNRASDGGEIILIDGIVTYVGYNGTSIGNVGTNRTDYGNITLDEGMNDFTVNGADSVNITFSFPFMYL